MLETVDIKAQLSKADYKAALEPLDIRLGELQRALRSEGIPVVIVLEGWDAAGHERILSRILQAFDPRGYKVNYTEAPLEQDQRRPPMRRFWLRVPAHGEITIFDRSWYRDVLQGEVEFGWSPMAVDTAQENICAFERQLAEDGTVILKFFLHIDREEQAKRLKKLRKSKTRPGLAGAPERRRHKRYNDFYESTETLLQRTGAHYAPWTLVPATDRRFATVKIAETIAAAFETALLRPKSAPVAPPITPPRRTGPLEHVDLSKRLERGEYEGRIEKLQSEVRDLLYICGEKKRAVVIVYEGWDAAGKGSNIRRVVRKLDPRAYAVVPVGAPKGNELTHHYLWRFWKALPRLGNLRLFDRSWYGRVLVERVEGFATPDEWTRAYREINEFEAQIAQFGTPVIKFWMHISKEVQLHRFQDRQNTPHKQWKVTDEDWRNREKWDEYWTAVSDMVEKTSTVEAPWNIVEGDDKLYARVRTMTIIRDRMKASLQDR